MFVIKLDQWQYKQRGEGTEMRDVVSGQSETIEHLPPLDAWKINPRSIEKFYAPVDDRGFVLPNETIETILELFDDGYVWPVDWSKSAPHNLRPDDHHFHWIADWYLPKHFPHGNKDVPRRFREHPSRRGIIPRQFHNVLHEVTLPPKVPRVGHMAHYLQSFEIARQLFDSAERALMNQALMDGTSDGEKLTRYMYSYEEIFKSYNKKTVQALGMKAFDVVGVSIAEVNLESFEDVVTRLGSCALRNVPNYTELYFSNAGDVEAA